MKFVRFDGQKTGLVVDSGGLKIFDVAAALQPLSAVDKTASETIARVLPNAVGQSWVDMIGRWDEVRGAFQTLNGLAESGRDAGIAMIPFETARLEAPLASPTIKIFAIGSNSAGHFVKVMKVLFNLDVTPERAFDSKNEGRPSIGFTIWPCTVVGPDATVAPPRGTLKFDYESECAAYLKRGGRYLESIDIWGYTAFNDLGIRDGNLGLIKESVPAPGSFNVSKNFDNGKAAGPWVVVDEGHDLTKLTCTLTVNGEVRQDWNLSEMVTSFDEMFTYLSNGITLTPGDMLSSGTGCGSAIESGMENSKWLKPGDVVEIKLEGAGTLRNTVGAW